MTDKSAQQQAVIFKGLKGEESEAKQSMVTVPIVQNYRAKSELVKVPINSHQNSTQQLISKSPMQSTRELQNKINQFQNNLLHVSNKQIYSKSQNNYNSDQETGVNHLSHQYSNTLGGSQNGSMQQHKRKIKKNFNGNMIDKITTNQNTPNTHNNFQSVYASDFLDSIVNACNNKTSIPNQTLLNNLKKVEVLPSLHQKQVANQYLVMDKKNGNKDRSSRNNQYSYSISNNSINSAYNAPQKNNSLDELKHNEYFNSSLNQSSSVRVQTLQNEPRSRNESKQINEVSEETLSLNRQKEKILQGVEELKKLRRKRNTQRKIKHLNKIKQRISQLQELEKQIPLIEKQNGEIDVEKQREIEQQLDTKGDGDSSVISMSDNDDCLSRCSDDIIFRQLDQISVTDAGDDRSQDRADEFDEVLSSKSKQSPNFKNTQESFNNYQQLPSISHCFNQIKSSKNASILESIIEEHQDYFDHKAGKCACGQCHCGRCQVKCLVNQKTPIFFDMKWASSYNRQFNQNKLNNNQYNLNDIKIQRQSYKPSQENPQDYTSTFKNDYKQPQDVTYQRIVKYDRIPESPLYSLSTYNSNYLDWKMKVPEKNHKLVTQKTVIQGTPLLGQSTMKKDYPTFGLIKKTDMIKPPDQSPFPKFSIQKHDNLKIDFKPSPELSKSDQFQKDKQEYLATPSYQGQYTTSTQIHDKKKIDCEGTKKIYEMYQRKIEKYQKKLQSELDRLQEAK